MKVAVLLAAAVSLAFTQAADSRSIIAERVSRLTRSTAWKLLSSTPLGFRTYHPQGMVRVGDHLFVSSVEVTTPTKRFPSPVGGHDRDAGEGVGHLFKIDTKGNLVALAALGEGSIYHPGGVDYDGTDVWVPVAEYRPDSRSIVYRVDPETLKATEVLRVADHLGAVVVNTDDNTLHGVSWGSRRFYRWTLDSERRVTNASAALADIRTVNPSHYVDYQDCKYAGSRRMLCTGVTEIRRGLEVEPFRLGGMDLVSLADARPVHQVPVQLWTKTGVVMTQNPVWVEPVGAALRVFFLPEDDRSTLYIYEVAEP